MWLSIALFVVLLISNPSHRDIGFLGGLLIAFLGVLSQWGRWLYQQSDGFAAYGLRMNRETIVLGGRGWLIGSVSLAVLFGVEGFLGWLSWQGVVLGHLVRVAVEGALVAIAVALGEELLFRGWLLNELDRDYSPTVSVWASSVTFAVLHFIKPLDEVIRTFPQFPGLVLLGLILVWARRSHQGQLGLAIGLHGGLVWGYYLIQVGQLIVIHPTAPELWVGIDQNPLAGGLGLLSLGAIALWVRRGK